MTLQPLATARPGDRASPEGNETYVFINPSEVFNCEYTAKTGTESFFFWGDLVHT